MEFKDPDEIKSFTLNWAADLSGITISSDAWTLDSGITKDSDANDTTTATVTISGGTLGKTYKVACAVTCSNGDIYDKFFLLRVQEHHAG
jgi:hypothetical protein